MFAYKTTTGSAPFTLISLLQTYVSLEACVLQVNVALFIPKPLSQTFTLTVPSWWPAQLNPAAESLAIYSHLFHLYLTL